MVDSIKSEAKGRMQKSIESLKSELSKLRTGRAHPSLLEHVKIDYYGNLTPLSQVASISVGDARMLLVSPWEKNMVEPIEKAILNSDLGLNPVSSGQAIRVPLPPLTEERRKEMTKVVRQEAENARIAIRNIRRDANSAIKDLAKDKDINEDDARKAEESMQQLTNQYIAEVDELLAQKEKDLTEV